MSVSPVQFNRSLYRVHPKLNTGSFIVSRIYLNTYDDGSFPDDDTIIISAPNGIYPGAPLVVQGGLPVRINMGPDGTGFDTYIWSTPVYQLYVNDTPRGGTFTGNTVIPMQSYGDTITVRDTAGTISNPILVPLPNGYEYYLDQLGGYFYDPEGGYLYGPSSDGTPESGFVFMYAPNGDQIYYNDEPVQSPSGSANA